MIFFHSYKNATIFKAFFILCFIFHFKFLKTLFVKFA